MDGWMGPTAAATLVILWSLEAFFPAFTDRKAGVGQRLRHLAVGGLNAGASAVAVLILVGAVDLARSWDLGLLRAVEWPWWFSFAVALVALDLWHYTFHVLAHHVPLLWRFHSMHHNAERMEATLAMRFHFVEVFAQALLTIPVLTLLGGNVMHVAAYNLVLVPVSMFHHSDLRLSPRADRLLRLLIVTPRMHWLHHSRWQPETNSNYSSVLSVWDRLFATMRTRKRAETVDFGLDGHERAHVETLGGMLTVPFSAIKTEYGERPDERDLEPDGPVVTRPSPRRSARARRA